MAVTRAGNGCVVPRGVVMRFGLLGLLQAEDGAGNVLPAAGPCRRLLLAALLVRVNGWCRRGNWRKSCGTECPRLRRQRCARR